MAMLLDAQAYALVHWRRAAREVNYRRFFDVNDLIALHMEDPEVFQAMHERVLDWVRRGIVDGLRIDHLDGLLDPLGYLQRLRAATHAARDKPGEEAIPVFVEKILAHGEHLPPAWPVAGTTGYEFLASVDLLFIDPAGMEALCDFYTEFLGRPSDWEEIALRAQRRSLEGPLRAPVQPLARQMQRIAQRDLRTRHLPLGALSEAIAETIACLRVYRTYVDGRQQRPRAEDLERIGRAITAARRRGRAETGALALLRRVLRQEGESPREERVERLRFAQRFQQLAPAVHAKGVEDTAFYVYVPLASRNEVGTDPGASPAEAARALHALSRLGARCWPGALRCVTTHDTKRSADSRARLHVLSELPELWSAQVVRWRRLNRSLRVRLGYRFAPDANTEYLLYQTLVAVWPLPEWGTSALPGGVERESLCRRVETYLVKAAREARAHTSWTDPDLPFEDAIKRFTRALLDPRASSPFLPELCRLVARIARPGLWNALSRTLIQLASPGVPDLYQGDELWRFTLVDPDNRGPVDFAQCRAWLDALDADRNTGGGGARSRALVHTAEDGRVKLHLVREVLRARRENPRLFDGGSYVPLRATGPRGHQVFAFLREGGGSAVVAIAPRLLAGVLGDSGDPPMGPRLWSGTWLPLPGVRGARLHNILTDSPVACARRRGERGVRLEEALADFPVALLLAQGSRGGGRAR